MSKKKSVFNSLLYRIAHDLPILPKAKGEVIRFRGSHFDNKAQRFLPQTDERGGFVMDLRDRCDA